MWLEIAVLLIGAIAAMVMLAPKPKIENARASTLNDFQFPRSEEGDPVGLGKGTFRLRSPNTIWSGAFKAVPIKKKVSTGLFSSTTQIVGYKYYFGLNLALCLGVKEGTVALKRIWIGKKVAWQGYANAEGVYTINHPNFYGGPKKNGGIGGTFAYYPGSMDQSQDSYLVSKVNANVPAYNGIAHIVFRDFYVGNNASIEPIHFEVEVLTNTLDTPYPIVNTYDQNPIEALYSLYVTRWGQLGVDPLSIDDVNFREAAVTLYNEGNGISLEIAKTNSGSDLTKEILRQINAIVFQDVETAKIKIKLIRRDYDVEDLPVLSPSNVREIKKYTKKLWEETYNQVRVNFVNRDNEYAKASALWQDFANINMQQRVRSSTISMPGVFVSELANEIAAREGAELNIPLFQCELEANRTVSALRPGDCFVLTWPEYGIAQSVMRIRKFDAGELTNGKVVLMCVQDEFSADAVVFGNPQPTQWEPPVIEPSEIVTAAVIAAPYWFQIKSDVVLTGNQALVWALPRKPSSVSLNFDVMSSLDGFATVLTSDEEASYAGSAFLVGAYDEATGFETGYDNSVDGIIVYGLDGEFVPTSIGDDDSIRNDGSNLLLIGSEIIGYRDVDTTGLPAGQYRLTNLRRALLDTKQAAHSIDDPVFFLSSIEGLGETVFAGTDTPDVRLLDNAPGGQWLLEDADDYAVAINSRSHRPAPPTMLTYAGVRTGGAWKGALVPVTWNERNRLDPVVRLYSDATQAPEAGQDNELRWRIDGGAWTTSYVAGSSSAINVTATAGQTLEVEVRSRRDGFLSMLPDRIALTMTTELYDIGDGEPFDVGDGDLYEVD